MKNNRLTHNKRNNKGSISIHRRRHTKCQRKRGRRLRPNKRLLLLNNNFPNPNSSNQNPSLLIIQDQEPQMPWISQLTMESKGTLKLHNEINDLIAYITPTDNSLIQREKTIVSFTKFIHSHWPNWTIKLYGSYIHKTQINESDLDFAVFKSDHDIYMTDDDQLISINRRMIKDDFCYRSQLLRHARVPIIKALCQTTEIMMDICVNRDNGHKAALIIQRKLDKEPGLRKIIIILKYLLKCNGLNNASSGGMSSFLLFTLVFFFYQQMKRRNDQFAYIEEDDNEETTANGAVVGDNNGGVLISSTATTTVTSTKSSNKTINERNNNMMNNEGISNLGLFFFGFLKFYTVYFNHLEAGITLKDGGHYLYKEQNRSFMMMNNNSNLTVENFQDSEIDIGRSCYKYDEIVRYFNMLRIKLKEARDKKCSSFFHAIGVGVSSI